jgi:hypothetical protein
MEAEVIHTNPVEFHGYHELEKYIGDMRKRGEMTQFDYENLMTGMSYFHNEVGQKSIFHLVRKDGHIYADVAEPMQMAY